jgi:mRNA-degrading endonuclease RelE of RelBE toxin-antitoxin system
VSPKRLDRVAPPPVGDEWNVRFGTTEAAKGWDELCVHATAKTREAFEMMRSNPRPPQDETHYQLRGTLATRSFNGRDLEQWQVKVSGSARIWYLPDDSTRTVWVIEASIAHPKKTEPRRGRR